DDDPRTAGQRRADALVEVFGGAARWAELPHAGGQRAQISYVISAAWAAGQAGAGPATAAWTGPQTRARLEAELCDARLSRVLLDADGQVVSLESVNDQISTAQRRAVSARDRRCVARGCSRPPAFCDVHHLIARKDGGPTTLDNLVLLCRRHHVVWHQGRLLLRDLDVPWLRKPLDPPMVA
ncbi:MAG: endonuclease, partial [Frankiales bacterium]|nr:endonuclease [Frankiales bacterium]